MRKNSDTSEKAKRIVLQRIGADSPILQCGKAKYPVHGKVVHIRYCSENSKAPNKYNLNANTISADFEIWICGNADHYYLLPVSLMQKIYCHPDGYVDQRHPKIRIVSVDTGQHHVTFARGGEWRDISSYFGATLA
jgi:hypothetical protein